MLRAHGEFLQSQFTAGKLVVSGPVLDPAGVFGVAVFEGESIDEVRRLIEKDPANAIGRYEVLPMGPTIARPTRPAGS